MITEQQLLDVGWFKGEERPQNNELVVYFFEPFNSLHIGTYSAEDDSVEGKSGFTTWSPEVTAWYPLPS